MLTKSASGRKGALELLPSIRKHPQLWACTLIATIAGCLLTVRTWRRRPARVTPVRRRFAQAFVARGLTDAEVAVRRPNVDFRAIDAAEKQAFIVQAVQRNTFTLANVNLFVIAVLMFFLGSPWSTFTTVLVLLLNVALNAIQEVSAKQKMDSLLHVLRPQATVIRNGVLGSVDVTEVVPGDMLAIGRGDEIFVNGVILGDGELSIGLPAGDDNHHTVKRAGDEVSAHTFCTEGRAIYEATEAGAWRVLEENTGVHLLSEERTPLRLLLRSILRVLFTLVMVVSLFVLADAFINQQHLVDERYREVFSLLFGVAPTSLYFILVIDYAIGLLSVARVGGLAYRSTAVESLANVSVLCISLRSILRGTHVTLEMTTQPDGHAHVSERLMRRMLGDMAHSASDRVPMIEAITDALPGQQRVPVEVGGHYAALGWYGISLRDPDMRGTFVIGEAALLSPPAVHDELAAEPSTKHADLPAPPRFVRWRHRVGGLVGRIRPKRQRDGEPEDADAVTQKPQDSPPSSEAESEPPPQPSRWRRFVSRLARLQKPQDSPEEPLAAAAPSPVNAVPPRSLIFAYRPEVVPLADARKQPSVPDGLISLARITLTETVRPEMVETIRALRHANVTIALLTPSDSAHVRSFMKILGLEANTLPANRDTREGAAMVLSQAGVARGVALLGLSSAEQVQVLRHMRARGAYTAMIGDGVGDLPAMREAQLRIALRSSSQAALKIADIVLLADSLAALPEIFRAGQRIINAVLNTLKLNLSQIGTQIVLLGVAVALNLSHFFYDATQAAVISGLTITLPNVLLRFWAPTGSISIAAIRQILVRFVIPTMIANSILAVVIRHVFATTTDTAFSAQLAITYALLGSGWLLILFVLPPTRFWAAATVQVGDRRVIWLAIGPAILFFAMLFFPVFERWLHIGWLPQALDYLVIGIALGVWTLSLRTLLHAFAYYTDVPSADAEIAPQGSTVPSHGSVGGNRPV